MSIKPAAEEAAKKSIMKNENFIKRFMTALCYHKKNYKSRK